MTFNEALQEALEGKKIRSKNDPLVYFMLGGAHGSNRVLEVRGLLTNEFLGFPWILEEMLKAEWEIWQ